MEIERKFLVSGDFKSKVTTQYYIKQGYLSTDPNRTVRVRIRDHQGFLTIKGQSSESGMSRFEWEREIPLSEAEDLLSLCLPVIIEKTRYIIPEGSGLFYELDVFDGEHKGLLLAEIELPSEDAVFERPAWLGKEVTGDARYYNSYLSSHMLLFVTSEKR